MSVDAGLRLLFRQHLLLFDWSSIETGLSEGGVPDSNYCYQGVEGWVEHKRADHWRCVVRPAQVGWIERQLDQDGRVFVAVRRARSELWLYPGRAIRALVSERLDAVPCLGHWDGGPAKWDWVEVARFLQTRGELPTGMREDIPNQRIPGKLLERLPGLS